eukprot:COSAG02_NODE_7143_length_3159_cov_2.671895_2_plen_87_part_00
MQYQVLHPSTSCFMLNDGSQVNKVSTTLPLCFFTSLENERKREKSGEPNRTQGILPMSQHRASPSQFWSIWRQHPSRYATNEINRA